MATVTQINSGVEALETYQFSYFDYLTKKSDSSAAKPSLCAVCWATPHGDRADFVSKMLARKMTCDKTEAKLLKYGEELDLLCKESPYIDFPEQQLATYGRSHRTYSLYSFDDKGPCGLIDFTVCLMQNEDRANSMPMYCIDVQHLVVSEDRRGEGLGSGLARCAAEAMLTLVQDNLPSVTKRGSFEIWFTSEIHSVGGWLAVNAAVNVIEDALGILDPDENEGRFCSRRAFLVVSLED